MGANCCKELSGKGGSSNPIATTDIRAQAHYLKAGVYPRFPLYFFARGGYLYYQDGYGYLW